MASTGCFAHFGRVIAQFFPQGRWCGGACERLRSPPWMEGDPCRCGGGAEDFELIVPSCTDPLEVATRRQPGQRCRTRSPRGLELLSLVRLPCWGSSVRTRGNRWHVPVAVPAPGVQPFTRSSPGAGAPGTGSPQGWVFGTIPAQRAPEFKPACGVCRHQLPPEQELRALLLLKAAAGPGQRGGSGTAGAASAAQLPLPFPRSEKKQ